MGKIEANLLGRLLLDWLIRALYHFSSLAVPIDRVFVLRLPNGVWLQSRALKDWRRILEALNILNWLVLLRFSFYRISTRNLLLWLLSISSLLLSLFELRSICLGLFLLDPGITASLLTLSLLSFINVAPVIRILGLPLVARTSGSQIWRVDQLLEVAPRWSIKRRPGPLTIRNYHCDRTGVEDFESRSSLTLFRSLVILRCPEKVFRKRIRVEAQFQGSLKMVFQSPLWTFH